MTIRRSPRREHYVIINQVIFDDERLDHRALGVLTYLLSKPDNWRTNSHQLSTRFHCNVTTVKGILAGLEELGYLRREKHRKPDGTFYWESTVFEIPTIGQKTSDGKTSDGKTSDGKLAHITNNEVTITELTKTDQDETPDDVDTSQPKPKTDIVELKMADPFYTGQARPIARELVKVSRQINAPKNFITDAPWGLLAEEIGKDATHLFQEFEKFLMARYSDKSDPDSYAKKICSSLYENPGSELACKPWIEFADYFRKNLAAPPAPKKAEPRQVEIDSIPDREASREAFKRLKG